MTITGHKIISLLSKSHQKPKCKAQYSLCQPFERQTLNVTSSYLFVTIDLVFINSCFLRVLYFRLCDWRPTGALNGLVFFGDGFFLDGERCVGKWTETGRLLGEFTIYIYIYTHTHIHTTIWYEYDNLICNIDCFNFTKTYVPRVVDEKLNF